MYFIQITEHVKCNNFIVGYLFMLSRGSYRCSAVGLVFVMTLSTGCMPTSKDVYRENNVDTAVAMDNNANRYGATSPEEVLTGVKGDADMTSVYFNKSCDNFKDLTLHIASIDKKMKAMSIDSADGVSSFLFELEKEVARFDEFKNQQLGLSEVNVDGSLLEFYRDLTQDFDNKKEAYVMYGQAVEKLLPYARRMRAIKSGRSGLTRSAQKKWMERNRATINTLLAQIKLHGNKARLTFDVWEKARKDLKRIEVALEQRYDRKFECAVSMRYR